MLLCVLLYGVPAVAEKRHVSGHRVSGLELLDKAMLKFMDTINCHAATVAVLKDEPHHDLRVFCALRVLRGERLYRKERGDACCGLTAWICVFTGRYENL